MATCTLDNGTVVSIVNPLTPNAFTPPELANQANVAAYFIVVSLTVRT